MSWEGSNVKRYRDGGRGMEIPLAASARSAPVFAVNGRLAFDPTGLGVAAAGPQPSRLHFLAALSLQLGPAELSALEIRLPQYDLK